MTKQTIGQIWKDIVDHDLLDDRFEYDPDELAMSYALDKDDSMVLWLAIQGTQDPDRSIDQQRPEAIIEALVEADHQDLDGWTDDHKVVIRAFMSDIGIAAHNTEEGS